MTILDVDQQGFLRSRSSLIQIMGRASRNLNGQVVLFADRLSMAMKQAIREVNRRRKIQLDYNRKHKITPKSVVKSIRPKIIEVIEDAKNKKELAIDPWSLTPRERKKHLSKLKSHMRTLATDLNFEEAIKIRDKIKKIEKNEK